MFNRDAAQVLAEYEKKKLPLVGIYNVKTGEVYLHPGFKDYIYVIVDKDKNFVKGHQYVKKHQWDKTVPIDSRRLKEYQDAGYAPRHFRYETNQTGPMLSSHLFILDGFMQKGESKADYRGFAISTTKPLTFAWTSSSLNVSSVSKAGYLPPPNNEKEPLPEYKKKIKAKVESLLLKDKKLEPLPKEEKLKPKDTMEEPKASVKDVEKQQALLPSVEISPAINKKETEKKLKPEEEAAQSVVLKTTSSLLEQLQEAESKEAFLSLKPITGVKLIKFQNRENALEFEKLCVTYKAASQAQGESLVLTHPEDSKTFVIYLSDADISEFEKHGIDFSSLVDKFGVEDSFVPYMLVMNSFDTMKKFMSDYKMEHSKSLSTQDKIVPGHPFTVVTHLSNQKTYGIYLSTNDLEVIQTILNDNIKLKHSKK